MMLYTKYVNHDEVFSTIKPKEHSESRTKVAKVLVYLLKSLREPLKIFLFQKIVINVLKKKGEKKINSHYNIMLYFLSRLVR